LGQKGFQVIEAAINENPQVNVPLFVQQWHPTFPVGWADRTLASDFMQISPMVRSFVPFFSLIDRKGEIRAQYQGSDPVFTGDQAANLRPEIVKLLDEGGPAKSGGKARARRK